MSNRAITFNSLNLQRETSVIQTLLFYWFCSIYYNLQLTDNTGIEKLSSLLMLLVQPLPTIFYYYKVKLWYILRQYELANLSNTFQLLNAPFFNCLFYTGIKEDWQKKSLLAIKIAYSDTEKLRVPQYPAAG